jgi:hypothetical protein
MTLHEEFRFFFKIKQIKNKTTTTKMICWLAAAAAADKHRN